VLINATVNGQNSLRVLAVTIVRSRAMTRPQAYHRPIKLNLASSLMIVVGVIIVVAAADSTTVAIIGGAALAVLGLASARSRR
jgi:hypothetical protein